MKKMIILAVCLIFSTIFAVSPVAISAKVKGDIDYIHNAKTEDLKAGTLLYNDDEVYAKEDSYAAIQFVDGKALLKVYPETKVKILAEQKGSKLVKTPFVNLGKVYAKVKKNTGNFEIKTPTAVASVKGTAYMLMVDDQGNTWLWVLEGNVKVSDNEGNIVEVPAGKKATPDGSGGYTVAEYTPEDIENQTGETAPTPEEESQQVTPGSQIQKLEIEIEDANQNRKKISIELE